MVLLGGSSIGLGLFHTFSTKSYKYDSDATDEKWHELHISPPNDLGAGTIYFLCDEADQNWWLKFKASQQQKSAPRQAASENEQAPAEPVEVRLEDFVAYMPMHNYLFMPTGETWPAGSGNARLPPVPILDSDGQLALDKDGKPKWLAATKWLDQNKPVEQMTWGPGEPMLIRDRLLVANAGWIRRRGCTVFNLYHAPILKLGNAGAAGPWLDHVRKIYPDDFEHIVYWLAHRVQRPQGKINHALVLGGLQGIGKDTLLEPIKRAVAPWNFSEVTPQHLLGRFNAFVKSVILRVNEARDLGDTDRFSFYERMKQYTVAPPDVLPIDEKHLRQYYVVNCCGVIITTNYKTDGIFLPADDRRHYVAWSDHTKDDFTTDYWNQLWRWYDAGGDRHVAAYLTELDISKFDPKAPPAKTEAFWTIVNAHRSPEDAELADVLEELKEPNAVSLKQVQDKATGNFHEWITDRKNRRQIPHRFEQCAYVPVRNAAAKDGLWKIGKVRQAVYAKQTLSLHDRLEATKDLIQRIQPRDQQQLPLGKP
jgi:hypothetical protein